MSEKTGRTRHVLRTVLGAVALLCLFVPAAAAQADQVTIQVSLDRDTIGMDEQALLQVTVSGSVQNLPAPRLPTLPMFEVYSRGRSSNISITNGVVSASVNYRYLIIPQKPGTFVIDNISVVYNNRRYKGNRVELTVLDRGSATPKQLEEKARDTSGGLRDYFLEAVVDKKQPYVHEQVTLTLKFYTAVRYYGSPELVEPTTTGFWTEVLGNKAPYYQKINGRNYKVIERKYALFPTRTGELTIGRAVITATVATRRRRDPFNSFFDDFFGAGREVTIRSEPVTVTVRPLPAEGRPDNFTGTVGRFSISAAVNKTTVEVNQPVSLTVKIEGVGNIKSVAEPIIPPLDDFRVYRESSHEQITKIDDRLGGTKTFEEVFIPRRPGKLTIPALEFNFFDPSTRRYRVLRTQPITLTVTMPEGYAGAPDVPYTRPELSISPRAQEIRYIKTELRDLRPAGSLILTSPLYVAVNTVPVLLLAGLVLVRVRRERLAADAALARSRGASRQARKRLGKARGMASTENTEAFFAEIAHAVTSFIADKYNVSPHGLTSDRLRELLQSHGVETTMVDRVCDLLQRADFARFAPASVTADDIERALQDAEQVIVGLERRKSRA